MLLVHCIISDLNFDLINIMSKIKLLENLGIYFENQEGHCQI